MVASFGLEFRRGLDHHAVLPALIALALTSTGADGEAYQTGDEAREYEDEDYEDDDYEDGDYEDEDYEDEDYEGEEQPAISEQDQRWFSERALHFGLHVSVAAVRAGDVLLFAIDVAFGFVQRLSQRWALQGRAAFGTGFGNTDDQGPFAGRVALFDSNIELTGRIGSRRFYFGLGPFGRFWRLFEEGQSFSGGGGSVIEIGWLLGDDRQLDIGGHVNLGGFFTANRDLQFMGGVALSVGWLF